MFAELRPEPSPWNVDPLGPTTVVKKYTSRDDNGRKVWSGGPMLLGLPDDCSTVHPPTIPRQFSPFPAEAGQFKLSSLTAGRHR